MRMASKPQTKGKEILELVQWIDNNKSKLIKSYDALGGMEKILAILFVVIFFISQITNLTISDFATNISIQLASFAVMIAFISFVFQRGEKEIVERRFKRALALKTFDDREKPLLKALIKIKSNNEEIKLMTIYEMNKEAHGDIFTEKKLLESICK